MKIETQVRAAVRDAVNRASRKPFFWGGLKGYQQLADIADGLHQKEGLLARSNFFQRLSLQMDRALSQNQALAAELNEAHVWFRQAAACLRYPQTSYSASERHSLTSQHVTQEMDKLLEQIRQAAENKSILSTLHHALSKRWEDYGAELLHCYDIPGLPQHNLRLEGFFNRMRCNQRRISGRKSTKELRDFGQFQALLMVDSQADLLEQIRNVPIEEYKKCRQRLDDSEAPRRSINQFHRNPKKTIKRLLDRYVDHQRELISQLNNPPTSACSP